MAEQLPQNLTFGETLQSANRLGGTLSAPKTKRQPVNVNKYSGINQGLGNVPTSPQLTDMGPITTPYGGNTKFEQFHPGVDVAGDIGTPVSAFRGGTVTDTRSGQVQGDPDFGNYVVVTDEGGNKWRYSHLSEGLVSLGSEVQAGQDIGKMGNTGQTYSTSGGTGSHLDLRILSAANKYLQPSSLLTSN